MTDEIETRDRDAPLVSGSSDRAIPSYPVRPLPWLLRKEKFVRAIAMVGLYVFAAIFLISMLAVGVFTLISLVIAALFLASLALVLYLWMRTRLRQ
jgi:hypothetical protein